ncbi:hypothetical protein LCGC14_2372950 [marine sediment metagenome]|uniref:Uncharacterized protein n=1 Tax=marine sediment metagenome TaxID=412755 RepID=A0A0F9C365_9ZZZZ
MEFGGDMYKYPTAEICEKVRELNQVGNRHIPGFAIAPACIEILVPPLEEDEPQNEELPI